MKDLLPVHNKKNGQSLIEVLAAMAVAVIIISGLVGAVIVAVRNAQFAKNQALATSYANEGMENTRQQRDENWDNFWSKAGTTVGPTQIGTTVFTKTINYDDVSGGTNDKMRVTVTVSWIDSSGTHKSQLVSFFTKPATWK